MRLRRAFPLLPVALSLVVLASPASAHHGTTKKAIWGPSTPHAFRIYHGLGVGIYEMTLSWRGVATTRPVRPGDPHDPAYVWPADVDAAIREANRHGIRVLLMIIGTPEWANGGRPANWAPTRASDLAGFAEAAARRYSSVRYWMVWGEPTRKANFMPLESETVGQRLTRQQKRAPRRYARMLDASYGALKRVNRRNIVIGGNSVSAAEISPLNWIRAMRLPNRKRPRMDMYGHNAFTARAPELRRPLVAPPSGYADFSDLDAVWGWLDRYGYRDGHGRPLRIFISEWTVPTDHVNADFNFYVTRRVQATWVRVALRIVRKTRRLYSLGWHTLIDDPPRPDHLETNRGLIDHRGRRKPAFYAFRRG